MSTVRDDLVRLLQDYDAQAGRLAQIFAERHALHPTDLDALLAVLRADVDGLALTPGRLGERLGLSSGATTAVIDRLERAEHVHRVRDDQDRRRVTLHPGVAAAAVGGAFFGPLGARMDRLLAGYTDAELGAVRRFLADTNALMTAYREEVAAH